VPNTWCKTQTPPPLHSHKTPSAVIWYAHKQRQQRDKLSSDCDQQLFRKEAQDAGDIRLLPRLFRACLPDKKQYCGDVAPGQAMSMACLEEHLESLSEACRCVGVCGCAWGQGGEGAAGLHTSGVLTDQLDLTSPLPTPLKQCRLMVP
jgi:hypothetical protein